MVLGVGVGGSVTSTPLPRIKPKFFQTQRGDVVWVQVPEVGHVVVGRHPLVELFLMTTDHSNIKVSADNNMSDHGDLDPNNIPSVGFDPPLL